MCGDLFKKYNDLMEKTTKITEVHQLKQTLQTMPLDFVPQYPKLDTVVVTEGDVFDFFRARSSSSLLVDPKQLEEEQKILNEVQSSSQLIHKETAFQGKKHSDPAPKVGKLQIGATNRMKTETGLGNKKDSGPLTAKPNQATHDKQGASH